jgi:hypothetical protein
MPFHLRSLVLVMVLSLCCLPLRAQWVETNGPFGGSIFAFAQGLSPRFYAGGYRGGVFRTTNSGVSWTQVNSGLTNTNVYAIATTHDNLGHDIVFAGTDGSGVFKSTNNGDTWTQSNSFSNGSVYALDISGTTVYAGVYNDGVYVSNDTGRTWTADGLANRSINTLYGSGTNLFAGLGGGGVFRTTDGGANWTQLNSGLTNTDVRSLVYDGNGRLDAGTYGGGVFASTNNGTTWSATGSMSSPYVNAVGWGAGSFGPYLIAATDGGGIYISTNGGTVWTQQNVGLPNLYVRALYGTSFAGTDGGGVAASTNGGFSWVVRDSGMVSSFLLSFRANGSNLYAGTFGAGLFLSTDNGTSWRPMNNGLSTTFVSALLMNGPTMYAGTLANAAGGGVNRSTDGGATWTPVNSGLTNLSVNALAMIGTNLFAGTLGGVFLSTNSGNSWTLVSNGLTNTQVNTLAVVGTNLFAGTTGTSSAVFLSTDNGSSWSATSIGWPNAGTNVYALTVNGTDLYVGISQPGSGFNAVYRTTDNGSSWPLVSGSVPTPTVRSMVFANSTLLAGTDGGVIVLRNNSWSAANTGLVNTQVYALSVLGTNLFAGTNGDGVWRRSISEVTDVKELGPLPNEFALMQNYPNPFNPSTTISFSLSKSSKATLRMFDVLGREVATLMNETKQPGTYSVQWDASGFASGIYFYRLQAGDYVDTKKLVFLK